MNPQELWQKRLDALVFAYPSAERALQRKSSYLYNAASTYFHGGLVTAFLHPEQDWQTPLKKGLEIMVLADEKGDFAGRETYPYNLAGMCYERYLGKWALAQPGDTDLLDREINLFVEGLYGKTEQHLWSLAPLPFGYLLRGDTQHLNDFWKLIASKNGDDPLPPELSVWKQVTELLAARKASCEEYLAAFRPLVKQRKTPQPCRCGCIWARHGWAWSIFTWRITGKRV